MADSGAVRTRRWKAHKQGDHHLCTNCDALRAPVTVPASGDTAGGPVDAQAALERQARRLEAACEEQPGNAALEKTLTATLMVLRGAGEDVDRELAAFDAEFGAA
jgi:hypothetical protein